MRGLLNEALDRSLFHERVVERLSGHVERADVEACRDMRRSTPRSPETRRATLSRSPHAVVVRTLAPSPEDSAGTYGSPFSGNCLMYASPIGWPFPLCVGLDSWM